MLYLLTVIILVFNWLAYIQRIEMTQILIITFAIIGLARGISSMQFYEVFNLKPFVFKVKTKENVIELVDAFLMSIVFCSNEILSKKFGLGELAILIVFTFIVYRFLFYNLGMILKKKRWFYL